MFPMTVTEDTIIMNINGRALTAPKDSIYFEQIKAAIRRNAGAQELTELFDAAGAIKKFTEGDFTLTEDTVLYRGEELPEDVTERILYLMREKLPYAFMKNYWKRLAANTSRRAQKELFKFMQHKGMCITESGMVRAYKAITHDWLDKHSRTFRNQLGAELSMPRNAVCDDADIGCSYGFHVGSLEYVRGFACGYVPNSERGSGFSGDRIVIVEFDPADAVSVPKDCSWQKIRVCKYRVIEEFRGELPQFENFTDSGHDEDDKPTFWDIYDDDDGDEVINITTYELAAKHDEAYEEGRADAASEITDMERAQIIAEAKAQAKAEAEAEIAQRLRAIAANL